MTRPTRVLIDHLALLHNVARVRELAPGKQIIAMIKANAYGCGFSSIVPTLDGHVDAYGVACMEEALMVRKLGSRTPCILFQGIFGPDELLGIEAYGLECVIHHEEQLHWILSTPLTTRIKVHVKINTGMNRLGFMPEELNDVLSSLLTCRWINPSIGLMTHFAMADVRNSLSNQAQLIRFNALPWVNQLTCSAANSAAILSMPESHYDAVRPGLMLYGISPFTDNVGSDFGLLPVMRLVSQISVIHRYPPNSPIGYGGTWQSNEPSLIGIVPIGYGDGYPRHIAAGTPVYINGMRVPIVGRVSMDMLTVDLTKCQSVQIGDHVELWGRHIPVETIARSAATLPYELICQLSSRVRF